MFEKVERLKSMRYGIDLDGVLADFGSEVVKAGNRLWPNKFPANYRPDKWNYDGYLSTEEWDEIWKAIKATPNFWEQVKPEPGLDDLRRACFLYPGCINDDVYFVTARATTTGDSPLVQSSAWLSQFGLWPRYGHSTVIPVSDSKFKQDLFRGLGLKYMLDDYGPTVQQLNAIRDENGEQFMHAYLLDQPWNQEYTELPRVFSVAEYLEEIHKG